MRAIFHCPKSLMSVMAATETGIRRLGDLGDYSDFVLFKLERIMDESLYDLSREIDK